MRILQKAAGVLVILALGLFAIYFYKKSKASLPQNSTYKFQKLPQEIGARVTFFNPITKEKKKLEILFSDVLDEHYKTLLEKQRELLIVAAYEQLIVPKLPQTPVVTFGGTPLKRPLQNVCSQYSRYCEGINGIAFIPSQKSFLRIDQDHFELQDIHQNTVPLLAVKTEVLNYILSKVDDALRTQALYLLAKAMSIPVQTLIREKIINESSLEKFAHSELKEIYGDSSMGHEKQMLPAIREMIKNKIINEYLFKNHFQLPIVVNVEKPSYDFNIRWDWTPYFGELQKTSVPVVLFADIFSDASKNAIKQLLIYRSTKTVGVFGFRPFFNPKDPLQLLAAGVTMCVWAKSKNTFWTYLEKALTIDRFHLEEELYRVVGEVGGDAASIKKCVLSREVEPVVNYHQQSAEFYKIINAPVLFVGQEVHIGPISALDFKKILYRQTKARP